MVVDDSAVIRGYFRRALESDPGIKIVSSAGNGAIAVETLAREPADVIVLDIEMPVMDGLTALPKLLEVDPSVKIVMASTLTLANADVSLKALSIGAADYVAKPTTSADLHSAEDFKRELIEKVKGLGAAKRTGSDDPRQPMRPTTDIVVPTNSTSFETRTPPTLPPTIVGIGSSTGGPQALMTVISSLPSSFDLPILISQHMPATFTGILAQHISKAADRDAREAEDGEIVQPNRIYIAPGNFHMIVEGSAVEPVIRLSQDPPENFCRPAVDPMFRSLAQVFGQKLLSVILTGMGHDGLEGSRVVVDAGGGLISQDEATSVVWGMPGAVATAGLCSDVLPVDQIAARIAALCGR
ncbi:MAG: chemotaxis-specific protein-glutamate methyltransferase CheB [Alphaproteobacteria bacterium]|nr:chemotaxis-specific protein-glutamate methyltransferase CheB [Alphaproteobacteria bacterium]